MKHRISCRDAGMDCDFSVESSDEREVMDVVRKHAKDHHDMDVSDDDMRGMMQQSA
ncbi:DUF1059 domain-containing protein [Halobium salinum]|uniref:DUF1059 domain-containing protein n=1 Tax=Halobium salinum TaxID=1364940 RepID=A0ABD5PDA9_9EURY|nr:DUF1059 domain-containing protein [Halobium salinum]